MVNPEQQLSKKQIKRLASKVRLIKFVIYGLVILAFSALNFLVMDILSLFKLDSLVNAIGAAFLPILGAELLMFSSETMVNESKYLSKIVEKLISAEQYIHSFFAMAYSIMPNEEHAALIFWKNKTLYSLIIYKSFHHNFCHRTPLVPFGYLHVRNSFATKN